MSAKDNFKFLYWDDPGDSQESVDNQKKQNHFDYFKNHPSSAKSTSWDDGEENSDE